MTRIDEVAPDLYRISVYAEQFDLQFNHFLVRDEEPLLFHTGMRGMFPQVREALSKVIDPATLRWISWSHFEVDECGALNEWLAIAPDAQAACGEVGAMVNVQDFASRPPRALKPNEILQAARLTIGGYAIEKHSIVTRISERESRLAASVLRCED